MRSLIVATAVMAAAVVSSEMRAQRATVDLRGGMAMPTQRLSGADLSRGPALGGALAVRMQPHLHLYAGWDWAHFGANAPFTGVGRDFEETGYTFGLRFEHPIRATSRVAYRLEAGGTYKHIETENDRGDVVSNSGHGIGYEVGGGALLPLAGSWSLVPGVRYRSLSRDIPVGNVAVSGDLRHVTLEVGVSRRF